MKILMLALISILAFTIAHDQRMTEPQKNAIRSAKSYLSFMAFSHNGFI